MADDEAPSPEQQAIFRSMTPAQRWEVAVQLYWSARRLKTAFVRSEFYLPPHEVMLLETRRESRGHFNVIHVPSSLKADVYPFARCSRCHRFPSTEPRWPIGSNGSASRRSGGW